MRKLLLSISMASTFGIGYGQITFTSLDLQESGKTYVTKTDTVSTVDLGLASSSAQNWDFSNLLMDYMSGPTFDLTSSTAYASDYPNSDLFTYGPAIMFGGFYGGAPVSSQGMDNGYMFWRKDATGFWTEGFMADEGPYAGKKVYTVPQEMILGTPATYGSNYPNYSRWSLGYSDNMTDVDTLYVSTVNKTQECDAWGSMTTPTAFYSDVLRIHESGIKVDSVYASLAGNSVYSLELIRDTFNNYIFVTNGIHYPIALVKCDKNNQIRSIEYYFTQGDASTSENFMTSGIDVFPNPFDNSIHLELSDKSQLNSLLSIYSNDGKDILTYKIENWKQEILLNHLESGIYFYSISSDTQKITGRIIKQ